MKAVALAFFVVACGGEELKPWSGCDPLDTTLCALPFPSSYYLEENPDSVSGVQVAFGESSLPMNIDGVQIKPTYWNEKDGFSTLTPIMTFFPNLSTSGLLGHDRLGDYLSENVSTVIVDVATGERVPHFAELDMSHDMESRRALRLYPVEPLQWGWLSCK